jgi:hypothetical protein
LRCLSNVSMRIIFLIRRNIEPIKIKVTWGKNEIWGGRIREIFYQKRELRQRAFRR